MRLRSGYEAKKARVEMLPLIDVVFLLLIFFLVATKFAEEERELDIVLPEASQAQPLISRPRELFVNIDAEGRFFVSGRNLSLDELQIVLTRARVNNPDRASVVIRADERARVKPLVAVMNACRKARIRDYKITARKES